MQIGSGPGARANAALALTAVVAVVAVVFTGCGRAGGDTVEAGGPLSPPAAAAKIPAGEPVCLDLRPPADGTANSDAARDRARLTATPTITAAALCEQTTRMVKGKGEWSYRVERRVTSGLERLLSALRKPDEPLTAESCLAYADVAPELWLLDSEGRAFLVRWPLDACRHIQQPAKDAFKALDTEVTGQRRLELITPQEALDTGCSSSWKQVVAIAAGDRPSGTGSFAALRDSGSGTVCRYRGPSGARRPRATSRKATASMARPGRRSSRLWSGPLPPPRAARTSEAPSW
jgi:hypothetical protein